MPPHDADASQGQGQRRARSALLSGLVCGALPAALRSPGRSWAVLGRPGVATAPGAPSQDPRPSAGAGAAEASAVGAAWRTTGGLAAAAAATTAGLRLSGRRRPRRHAERRRGSVSLEAGAGGKADEEYEVAVVGAGPAGYVMAHLLAERHGRNVCLIDPNASKPWPNNYGVWQDEWDALEDKLQLGLQECLGTQWDVTDCYFGGSWDMPVDDLQRLDRKYARVERNKLKAKLVSPKIKVINEGWSGQVVATNVYAGGLFHDAEGSTLTLSSGKTVRAKLIVDCTGAESKLTRRVAAAGESSTPLAGYQIAYGFVGIIEGDLHYKPEAMTLFDYRTDHLSIDPAWEKRAEEFPTFMYVMPLGKVPGESNAQKVFFEETSLVARPAMSFEECKKRCFRRLEFHGIKIRPGSIEEEEFCYIPMGGELPEPNQRVVAFGGAAAMVHPSTGYQLCRMLAASSDVAATIGQQLEQPGVSPDAVAGAAYDAIWSQKNQGQRAFAIFGGELLMEFDVESLRGWFQGFFELPTDMWGGFLAGWPGLPGNKLHETWYERLWFGLNLVVKLPGPVTLQLVKGILGFTLTYGFSLFRSVTPIFGQPPSYLWEAPTPEDQIGDVPAKKEAMAMIAEARKKEKVGA